MTTSEPGTTDARGLDPSLQHAQRLISESASARPGTAHGNESLRCNLLGRALEALQLKPDAAQQAEAQQAPSAALRGARAMLDQLLGQVAEPQPELFSSPGGEPMEPLAQQRPAAEEYFHATALQARLLACLLPLAGPLQLAGAATEGGSGQGAGDEYPAGGRGQTRPRRQQQAQVVVGIVEVTEEGEEDDAAAQAIQQQQLIARLLLLCATHDVSTPSSSTGSGGDCAGNEGSSIGGGTEDGKCGGGDEAAWALVQPPAPPPWTSKACGDACGVLLQALVAAVHVERPTPQRGGAGGGGSSAGRGGPVGVQALLEAALPAVLGRLRDPLLAQHRHQAAQERGNPEPYQGPGPFQRTVAAARLLWLAQQLSGASIAAAAPALLPLTLAAVEDPTYSVQRNGHYALSRLALCAGSALAFQSALLLDTSRRLVVGCDAAAWSTAVPTALAVVLVLEGEDARAAGTHALLSELLTEAERAGHKPALRRVFIACAHRLARTLQLQLLRHFSRLLPLLLEWVHAYDPPTRLAALACLRQVLQVCWPRLAPHAGLVWEHLIAAVGEMEAEARRHARAAGAATATGAPTADAVKVEEQLQGELLVLAQLLGSCGGEAITQAVEASAQQAAAGGGLLQRLVACAQQQV